MSKGRLIIIPVYKEYSSHLTRYFALQDCESPDLDLSDDEELQQAFDMHSLIMNSLHHEPLFTAEQVINEIEGMMEEVYFMSFTLQLCKYFVF